MSYIIYFIIYLLQSYLIWRIARKMSVKPAVFAWFPIASDYLVSRLAGKHFGWWLLFYVPIVNIYVAYVFWTEIMRRYHKPFWLGIFMLIPLLNLIVLLVLAFVFKFPLMKDTVAPTPAAPPVVPAPMAETKTENTAVNTENK